MNHVPIAAPPLAKSTSFAAPKAMLSSPGGNLFRTTLSDRLNASRTAAKTQQPAALSAEATERLALEAKIAKLIESGASPADIIQTLAGRLADSIAHKLDSPGADARKSLQTVFATALAPPGEAGEPEGTVAGRARDLAGRYLRLKALADSIAGQDPGQQSRIAGDLLDAQRAKDIPAPSTTQTDTLRPSRAAELQSTHSDTIRPAASRELQDGVANAALRPSGADLSSASASPSLLGGGSAAVAPPLTFVLPAAAANGDGRTVKLGAIPALATGGDTTLGRVLARAVLAADARQAPAPISGPDDNALPSDAAGSPDAAVAAFAKSLNALLAANVAADSGVVAQHGALAAAPPELSGYAAAPMAPFAIDRVTAPQAPAAPPAPDPIDHSAIADQVLRGAFINNVGQSSEVRLSLVPESLGDVRVKLIVAGGSVTAHVIAETPQVRDALVAAQPQLSKSLADAGLKLSSFTVDLSGSGFAGFSQQQQNRSDGQSRGAAGYTASDTPDETPLEAVPSFGPSLSARPSAGDFNSLA